MTSKIGNNHQQTKQDNAFDDGEFDVIESEPDSFSSEESETENKPTPAKNLVKEDKKKRASAEEKQKKIEATKIGIKEFLQVLDYRMLGYFWKSIFYYAIFAFCLCVIYIICIYNFNKVIIL